MSIKTTCIIYRSPNDHVPCDTFLCDNMIGFKKYSVGDPTAHIHKNNYCEPCMRELLEKIPAELQKAEINYKCDTCGEEFSTPQALGTHKRKHPPVRA